MPDDTKYGQSHAAALAVAALLEAADAAAGALCLDLDVQTTFVRRRKIEDIKSIADSKVSVDVIPGSDMGDREAMGGIYGETYGVHVLIQQQVSDESASEPDEDQVALLVRLRSEIVEYLCPRGVTAADAVHPFSNATIMAHRHGEEGVYDLGRLEESGVFYSDLILTIRAAGLRRKV